MVLPVQYVETGMCNMILPVRYVGLEHVQYDVARSICWTRACGICCRYKCVSEKRACTERIAELSMLDGSMCETYYAIHYFALNMLRQTACAIRYCSYNMLKEHIQYDIVRTNVGEQQVQYDFTRIIFWGTACAILTRSI